MFIVILFFSLSKWALLKDWVVYLPFILKTLPYLILKRGIKQVSTSSLFSSLLHRPKTRSRVVTLIFNKYTLVAISSIALKLTMRKETKANSKGQGNARLKDSTPVASRTKLKLRDDDDLDIEMDPVYVGSKMVNSPGLSARVLR